MAFGSRSGMKSGPFPGVVWRAFQSGMGGATSTRAVQRPPFPWLSPHGYRVGAGTAVVPVLVAGAVGLVGAGAVGCGADAVTGVTVMPTTAPLTLFFWFAPIVCRA